MFANTFQLSNIPTINIPFLPFAYSNLNRLTPVARYALSDLLTPLFTSVLGGRYHLHRCSRILTSGEESWAKSSTATPHLFPTKVIPTGQLYVGYRCVLVCAMRNALDSA